MSPPASISRDPVAPEPVPVSALVFDLDGTLVDSRRDLATAINRTREDFGLAPLSLDEVVARVGLGAARLVRSATEELGAERAAEALARFFHHYDRVLLDTTRIYPAIEPMLETVGARWPLAVLTNKPEGFSRRVLEGLGLARYFEHLLGGDSLATRKPDPEGLLELARRWDLPPRALLMVGDARTDAETAAAAGARFAFVTWGFAQGEEAEAVIAATREREGHVLNAPDELAKLV